MGSPRSLYLKICQDVYHIVNDFHVCNWLLSYDSFKISAILAISLKHNNPDIIEKVNLDAQLGKSDHFIMEMILQNVLLTENKKPFYYNFNQNSVEKIDDCADVSDQYDMLLDLPYEPADN